MLSGSAWLARPTSTNLHAVGRLPAAACRGQVQRPGDRLDAHRASLFCPTAPWRAAWPFCLSFCLIHPRPGPFTGAHPDRVCAVHERWRTLVNAGQHYWKACWGQPLASSNLASSATSDQAILKPRSCFGLGLPGCVVSFAVSFIPRISVENAQRCRRTLLSAIAVVAAHWAFQL